MNVKSPLAWVFIGTLFIGGCEKGEESLLTRPTTSSTPPPESLTLSSSSFQDGGELAEEFQCTPKSWVPSKKAPQLSWSGTPPETKSLALVITSRHWDMDSDVVHVMILNIPPDTTHLDWNNQSFSKPILAEALTYGGGSRLISSKTLKNNFYYGPCSASLPNGLYPPVTFYVKFILHALDEEDLVDAIKQINPDLIDKPLTKEGLLTYEAQTKIFELVEAHSVVTSNVLTATSVVEPSGPD